MVAQNIYTIDRTMPALDQHEAMKRAIAEQAPSACEQCGHTGSIGGELVIDSLYAGRVGRPVVACRNLGACWQRRDRRTA